MTNAEKLFLSEVAAELVASGLTEPPTAEQMLDAMKRRLARQEEIFSRYCNDSKFKEFVQHGMAIDIYHDINKSAARDRWLRSESLIS